MNIIPLDCKWLVDFFNVIHQIGGQRYTVTLGAIVGSPILTWAYLQSSRKTIHI